MTEAAALAAKKDAEQKMARKVEQDELKDPGAKTKKDIAFAFACKDAKARRAIAEALASEPEATVGFKLERQYASMP